MNNQWIMGVGCIVLILSIAMPASALNQGQNLFDAGVFAYEAGDYAAAQEKFEKAVALNRNDPLFNYYLAKTHIKTGNYAKALIYMDTAKSAGHFIPGLDFDWAFVNYKLGNYEAASQYFVAVAAREPSNALARYYAGMSFYKQKAYSNALIYLEAAAGMKTGIRYNSAYYAGICYQRTGDTAMAERKFRFVRTRAPDDRLGAVAARQLAYMRQQKRQEQKYSLRASLGGEYDDNVLLEPIDNDALYEQEDDFITTASLGAGYDVIKTSAVVIGGSYTHYQMWYDDFHQYDLTGSLFDLHARFRRGAFTMGLAYKPAYYWLDSSSYLMRHAVSPVVSWQRKDLLTELSYTYRRNNNMDDNDEDGHTNKGMLRFAYTLPEEIGLCRAGLGYQVNSAAHDDYDYDRTDTEAGLYLNAWWDATVGVTAQCRFKKYDHADSTYSVTRDDTKYIGSLFLEKALYKDILSGTIIYEYTENDSNISDYEYRSNAIEFFISARL
ncbi:MAG: tetratricopeptide repeat protein [Thermodesulfobacteriota bacterium]|nr:tetratricopeptide repeat protein [Thermodesulfobacteriota bacterium]